MARAQGQYVCILNPDTAVVENCFNTLLSFSEAQSNLGVLGVKLIDGSGHFLPESKRNVTLLKTAAYKILGIDSVKNPYYARHLDQNEVGKVSVLVGAFMMLKKEVYLEVGGFDEAYFMFGEDIDLSYKLMLKGYVNYYMGTITTLHYKGESTIRDKTYLKHFYGAMQIFYRIHFKSGVLKKLLIEVGMRGVQFVGMRMNSNKSQKMTQSPLDIYLLTDDMVLQKKLSKTLKTTVSAISIEALEGKNFSNTQLVFDVNYMSYSAIFEQMQRFKGSQNTFRIIPFDRDYLLGSDCSEAKGEYRHF